jgi:tryptophanyl-tRNA synthetase
MARVLSGIQPSGDVHLGNYVGALRNWVQLQDDYDAFFPIVDLHALTLPWEPSELTAKTLQTAQVLLAAGIDPDRATIFVQSHVPEHTELCWILNNVATMGELSRMVQFKEKTRARAQDSASVGLFDYPVLMAADILIYDADLVPVGEDQRQHLELTRNIAQRFNNRFGETFVVPEAAIPKLGAKIYDLQDPTSKMSKSADSPRGTVMVFDPPEAIERKVKRAVTDPQTSVRYDPEHKPGVSNLLTILAVATGRAPEEIAEDYSEYGPLKASAAAALIEFLRPVRERYAELADDPGETAAILKRGAEKAQQVAGATLARAKEAIGLLPRA